MYVRIYVSDLIKDFDLISSTEEEMMESKQL